ncbi:hypothetical protein N9Y42_06995 [Mariniblastus sp.]|nr:hypothetical protein [Mariniblastus sp.]
MIEATLRLLNAVHVNEHGQQAPSPKTLEATIPFGYVLDPDIAADPKTLALINDRIGISGQQANATFHKSWEKVRSEKIEQLVLEQLIHYMTTYGFKERGIYDPSTVYIPNEKLELPQISDDLSLTYIRGLTGSELLSEIVKLGSGVAVHEKTLSDIMTIVKSLNFEPDFLDRIGNHELRAQLYDFYKLVPTEPVEFLRYVIFRVTGSSLLIKNQKLIDLIKAVEAGQIQRLDSLIESAPADLASIFYRFKPIFLAMKSVSKNKTFFNRLRKKAVKLHRPLPVDYLNSVTEQIKKGELDFEELSERVANAPVFRKIRLAYALQFRLNAGQSIVYPVRNGTGWATEFDWPAKLLDTTQRAFEIVFKSLVDSLRSKVEGKQVFIPPYVNYSLPATEKQFAGPFPFGSYVTTAKDTVFGIHWSNVDDYSVDLDLSLLSAEGKIGWDASYRNETALFSGDMTDAPLPNGASEVFYVKNGIAPHLVICNYYNFSGMYPVDAKILVAKEAPKKLSQNHMVDTNSIVAKAEITINRIQTILGLVLTIDGQTRFYFGNVSVGCAISAADSGATSHSRNYLTDRFASALGLRETLEAAGATVVDSMPQQGACIDLSPENLTKSSIIGLLQ